MKLIPFDDIKEAKPLYDVFDIGCVANSVQRQANTDAASKRGLYVCGVMPIRQGKLAIVASGPSAKDYLDTLRKWKGEIWGINGAFHWMIMNGIKPDAFVGIDPEWFLKDYLIDPPKTATYYLAAQCDPQVFDHLKDHEVHLFYTADPEVKPPIGSIPVCGHSTCMTRAPYLACMLGWKDVHIFGGDSSYNGATHAYGGKARMEEICWAENNGRVFATTRLFLQQAVEMVTIIQNFPGSITIYGDGLMQEMAAEAKRSGASDWLSKQEAKEIRRMNKKRKRRSF